MFTHQLRIGVFCGFLEWSLDDPDGFRRFRQSDVLAAIAHGSTSGTIL